MKYWYALIVLSLLAFFLQAQIPANPIGLNPPSLKWEQINTDKVQVIFPREAGAQAQRVANVVHYLWDHSKESIGDKKHKVSIIMHNQTNIPNGFVTVGPFRSEFYLTSPQFNCATDWLDVLAIHEYRHVQQFGNSRRGITQLAKSTLGSWAWGGLMATALPRWYFEGDAVGMETALTNSGRGRLPAFDMEYRSLVLNNIHYKYEKAAAGSLKDFVPDWYSLGYYLTTYGRKHYGADLWQGVANDAVQYKGLFFPFSHSLKKRTGLSTRDLYQATRAEMDERWLSREKARVVEQGTQLNTQKKKTVIQYSNPHPLTDGSVVVEKRGFDRITQYIRITADGREQVLTTPGIVFSPPESTVSVRGRYLCWSEVGFGVRWVRQDYSNIVLYDWVEGRKQYLTARSRYFSPDIAPDGASVVAVGADDQIEYYLAVLDLKDGSLQTRLPNPGKYFFLYPRWSPDGKHLAVVGQKDETHAILWVDPATGAARVLTQPGAAQLTHPYVQGDHVFFSAAYTGINNIFAVRIATGELFQVTDDALGAFQPSVSEDGKTLFYSAFSPEGFNVRRLELGEANWQPYTYEGTSSNSLDYYQVLVEQEGGGSIVPKVSDQTFQVKKFNRLSGIINPHSLLPVLDPPLFGAQLYSDNKFSTLSASAGGYYNSNDNEWTFQGRLSYAELFPVFNLNFQQSNRSTGIYNYSRAGENAIREKIYTQFWRENRWSAGMAIPLNLSKGIFSNRINLSANYQYTQLDMQRENILRDTSINVPIDQITRFDPILRPVLGSGAFHGLDLRFNWRFLQRPALQHITSRLGFQLDALYRTPLSTDQYVGNVFLARADVFLPGLARTHNFYINSAYQKSALLDNYRYSDFFFYPRGYDALLHDELYKIGVNYSLPLLYPDLALGPVAFLKRVKANLFYDYGVQSINPLLGTEDPKRTAFSSAGAELTLDFRALRLVEVDLGVRYSYLFNQNFAPSGQQHQFDFLLISISE